MALRLRRWLACLMLSGLGVSGTGWLAMCQAAEPDTAPKPAWDVNHPPGEALVVPIDTRTGTWMSVDVSPDGQRILFDLLGDLYELPIAGEPADMAALITADEAAMLAADYPKLFFSADPGATVSPAAGREIAAKARHCRHIELAAGRHNLQEDHPHAIGQALAGWIGALCPGTRLQVA